MHRIIALSATLLLLVGVAGAQAPINGTNGPDNLEGTSGPDVMNGYGGADVMNGHEGDDNMDGGPDVDIMKGDAGEDNLNGGDDNDFLYGGDDYDCVSGGNDADCVDGGPGRDECYGDDGDDTVAGGPGGDWEISGGPGYDFLFDGEKGINSSADCDVDKLDAVDNQGVDHVYCGSNDIVVADPYDYIVVRQKGTGIILWQGYFFRYKPMEQDLLYVGDILFYGMHTWGYTFEEALHVLVDLLQSMTLLEIWTWVQAQH